MGDVEQNDLIEIGLKEILSGLHKIRNYLFAGCLLSCLVFILFIFQSTNYYTSSIRINTTTPSVLSEQNQEQLLKLLNGLLVSGKYKKIFYSKWISTLPDTPFKEKFNHHISEVTSFGDNSVITFETLSSQFDFKMVIRIPGMGPENINENSILDILNDSIYTYNQDIRNSIRSIASSETAEITDVIKDNVIKEQEILKQWSRRRWEIITTLGPEEERLFLNIELLLQPSLNEYGGKYLDPNSEFLVREIKRFADRGALSKDLGRISRKKRQEIIDYATELYGVYFSDIFPLRIENFELTKQRAGMITQRFQSDRNKTLMLPNFYSIKPIGNGSENKENRLAFKKTKLKMNYIKGFLLSGLVFLIINLIGFFRIFVFKTNANGRIAGN